MSKKELISSELVRAAARRGEQVLYLRDKTTIVTAEALSAANALGLSLTLQAPGTASAPGADSAPTSAQPHTPSPARVDEAAVRKALAAQTGGEVRADLLAEVMRRIAAERGKPSEVFVRKLASVALDGGVKSGETALSTLNLANLLGPETAPNTAPHAAGFMRWSKQFMAFHRPHDELMLVLEGELLFRMDDARLTAIVGDVVLVPRNVSLEMGSTGAVLLFYASYTG